MQSRCFYLRPGFVGRERGKSLRDRKGHAGAIAKTTAKFPRDGVKRGSGGRGAAIVRVDVEMQGIEHLKGAGEGDAPSDQFLGHFLVIDGRDDAVADMRRDQVGPGLIAKQRQKRGCVEYD